MNAKEEIASLRQKIEAYNAAYYDKDQPLVSDFEYDELTRRLRALEAENPEFINARFPDAKGWRACVRGVCARAARGGA